MTEQSLFLSSNPIEDASNHGLRPRNVLVVEGEPSIRNVLYVLLAGLGCQGDIADGGFALHDKNIARPKAVVRGILYGVG